MQNTGTRCMSGAGTSRAKLEENCTNNGNLICHKRRKSMNKYYIKTADVTSIIRGEKMFIDGDTLYVYDGDRLKGMYKLDSVVVAYETEAAK